MMVEGDDADIYDDFHDEMHIYGEYEVEPSEGDSDTDQEASDDDGYETINLIPMKTFFYEQSKEQTKLNKNFPTQRNRLEAHNIIRNLLGAAKMAKLYWS